MTLTDWAALWDPTPDDRPCQVWLPAQRTADHTAASTAAASTSARPGRAPQTVVLALTPDQVQDLPCAVPRLLADTDVRTGDVVSVDLGSAVSVDLIALRLLLSLLWRRVGGSGEVVLCGGSPGLRAQLKALGIARSLPRCCLTGSRTSSPPPVHPDRPALPLFVDQPSTVEPLADVLPSTSSSRSAWGASRTGADGLPPTRWSPPSAGRWAPVAWVPAVAVRAGRGP